MLSLVTLKSKAKCCSCEIWKKGSWLGISPRPDMSLAYMAGRKTPANRAKVFRKQANS